MKIANYSDRNKGGFSGSNVSGLSRTMSSISAPAGPFQFSLDYDLSQLGNILEGATINYLVQLISNLGHFSVTFRLQAGKCDD